MYITIEAIPHSDHRYPTVGDWQIKGSGTIHVRVSRMPDDRYEFLVGIHEAIEAFLCMKAGVSQDAVDQFDREYETNRSKDDDSEPGDSHTAPYYRQHQIATGIERILAAELGVDWNFYESVIAEL
jgi:hypothetical protein